MSFSAFPQTILANTLDTHANVSLRAVDPSDPNKIRDPYDPDLNYPGDSNDPGNNGTGSVGQLTLDYVSNLRFGTHSIKQGGISVPATNTHAMVQITDLRGNGNGWTLQLKPEALVGEQTSSQITDGYLYLGSEAIRKPSDSVSDPPITQSKRLMLGEFDNVLKAPKNTGLSTWILGLNQNTDSPTTLVLNNIDAVQPDHYVGSLDWSLTNAPS
ncbi:WxL domain-containing protein [Companilactobacillus mishanensis]|uniref:WxL domain-containing protein n=1 Tax=Companilactobacillus mishanensis TaxID=2486008 RepID=UPI001864AE66|nr:WxL domain-containing protein [Companilactobacillus mishanensis]